MKTFLISYVCILGVLVALPACDSTTDSNTDSSFEFRGIRMGSSMSDTEKMIKIPDKHWSYDEYRGMQEITIASKKDEKMSIADFELSRIVYVYFKDRLYRIDIRAWHSCKGMQPLMRAFEKKYNIKFREPSFLAKADYKAKKGSMVYEIECENFETTAFFSIYETNIVEQVSNILSERLEKKRERLEEAKRINEESKAKRIYNDL
jgi:hypothetical protein